MLINFTFSNFHSFNEETTFDMRAGATRRHASHISEIGGMPILKYTAIYGANAAGKSSFIKALRGSRMMIRGEPLTNYSDEYCRCIPENRERPTSFEYLFETGGRFFQYGFEAVLSSGHYSSEWLYEVEPETGMERKIFSIESGDKGLVPDWSYFTEEAERTRLEQIRFDSDSNDSNEDYDSADEEEFEEVFDCLFLSKMKGKKFNDLPNLEVLRTVFRWFSNKLRIDYTPAPSTDEDIQRTCEILSRYDTDLAGGEYRYDRDVTESLGKMMGPRLKEGKSLVSTDGTKLIMENGVVNLYSIHTAHSSCNADFSIHEESNGTRHAMNIAYNLFCSKEEDVTFILDEFGLAMHPLLVSRMLKDYQEHNTDNNNQLIMATHHTSIMNFDHLRRDEVWFIDKENGISQTYSLEDFGERPDAEVTKRYLEGRYGALPLFADLVNNSKEHA
ncbi:MAG: AAA family ATPase [archaeon]|nr:AAA family ATPase [archaeon]